MRRLVPEELGVDLPPATTGRIESMDWDDVPAQSLIEDDDNVLTSVQDLLNVYGGVLFTGPPGTSKSFYAEEIALKLAGAPERVRMLQFHPSYGYEDFVEGYVAEADGYVLKPKHFLLACQAATQDPERKTHVLVIDELSRADPGRVFGEALTYLEKSKRGKRFQLASGRELSVPDNLVVLATMNPNDRGVDDVDAAMSRRFGKFRMSPSESILVQFLIDAGMKDGLRDGSASGSRGR